MTTEQTTRNLPGSLRDRSLQAERQGGTAAWAVDSGQHVPLWDTMEGAWTSPVPRENSRDYLDRRVVKCSVCSFTALDEELMLPNGQWIKTISAKIRVGEHLRQLREREERHQGAEIATMIIDGRPVKVCTGCDVAFAINPYRAQEHLAEVHSEARSHKGKVEGLLIHKFSLRPSEPVVLERILIAPGLEASPIERSEVSHSAKRRRRHNRSRH